MTIQSEIQALKCADCARSDSAVSDLKPDSMLPIPADALTGWSEGRPGSDGITRRKLLRNGVLGFAAVYGATQLSFEEVWESAVAQAAEPMQRSIVVVYLNGGNDGLNCFVPTSAPEYAKYQSLRPTIARVLGDGTGATVGTTIMPNTGGNLAFSNKLVSGAGADRNLDTKGFDTLYGDGTGGPGSDLAIIPAADYNPPNRSHFESRDYWFAGALAQLQTGWLGRWLDNYGSATNPLQAVSLDSSLSKQIRSLKAPVCALEGLQGVGFGVPRRHRRRQPRGRQAGRRAIRGRQRRPRPLARHDGPHGRRGRPPLDSQRRRAGRGLPAQQRSLAEAAARGDAALGGPRHAHHHDRLGQLRHARRPDRGAGSAAHRRSRERWPRSRPTWPRAASSSRS